MATGWQVYLPLLTRLYSAFIFRLAEQSFQKSPFDCGYKITVFFPDDDLPVPEDDEIEEYLRKVLSDGNLSLAEEVILEHNGNYSGNLIEKSFEIAEEVGCREFIDKNKQNL